MDDPTLAALEHQNLVHAYTIAASQMPDAVVGSEDGVATFLTGMPVRLFNQLVITDGEQPGAEAALRRGVALARDRGDRFIITLRPGSDARFRPMLAELGLQAMDAGAWLPGMALSPIGSATRPAVTTSEVEIHAATDGAGVRDHVVAGAAGFEMPIEWLEAVMNERMLDQPDATVYVGYLDGTPVVTGLGVRTGRTIGVYNIATVPAARRRGFGALMTQRVVDDGAAAGCDVAVLQASDMGRPIYERMGFRLVIDYDGFIEPELG